MSVFQASCAAFAYSVQSSRLPSQEFVAVLILAITLWVIGRSCYLVNVQQLVKLSHHAAHELLSIVR